jgi:hypothetical protein
MVAVRKEPNCFGGLSEDEGARLKTERRARKNEDIRGGNEKKRIKKERYKLIKLEKGKQ